MVDMVLFSAYAHFIYWKVNTIKCFVFLITLLNVIFAGYGEQIIDVQVTENANVFIFGSTKCLSFSNQRSQTLTSTIFAKGLKIL